VSLNWAFASCAVLLVASCYAVVAALLCSSDD